MKHIRSGFIICSRASRTAQRCTSSIRAAPRPRCGATRGWAFTSAPTSRSRNAMARVIIHEGLHDQMFIERGTTDFERVPRARRAVHARLCRARHRRARGRHSFVGDPVRQGRSRDDLLDARYHRTSQRGRQRHRADQPRAAHRTRRTLRLRMQSAARTEQRAGRRRHGRAAQQAAGLSGRRERRASHEVRARVGTRHHSARGLESDGNDSRDGDEGAHRALRHRRESRAVGCRRTPRHRAARAVSITSSCRRSSSRRRRSSPTSCFPAAATWAEGEGTVTNSERRVQRVRER